MISKRPLTASIASFAMGGLLAAVVLSFAETPAPTPAPTPAYIAPIKYIPGQPIPSTPKRMITLHRGMYDRDRAHCTTKVIAPAGVEVEIVENDPIREGMTLVKYNGERCFIELNNLARGNALKKVLSGEKSLGEKDKTLKPISVNTVTYDMIVEPGTEVELLDDTASTTVLVRFEGNVYQISRGQTDPYTSDKTAENAKNNPTKYAAEGVRIRNFLENSQIVPGIKERQPEGLWEKANRMDPCAPHDCRMAFRDIKMPSSAVPIWEMIAAYDLEKLPAWINGDADVRFARGKSPQALKQITWEEENKTTVGIVDYTSLRPEFAKWDVRIKTGNPTYTCGVVTAQDTLEYLWSKRMGFPVKADAALIRKKWDDNNAKSGRNAIRKGKGSPEDPMGEGTDNWMWDYLASDGGYSVLTPESKARIPATALPKLVTRQLCLGYQDNQGFHNPPLTALMVDELKKGHVIVASGAQAGPKQSSAKSKIQSVNGSSNPSYPFPRMDADPNLSRSHDQLITGYYVQYDLSAFPKSGGLFWEFRGNWGYTYGDHGYAYIPDGDLGEVYKTALFSVALE